MYTIELISAVLVGIVGATLVSRHIPVLCEVGDARD